MTALWELFNISCSTFYYSLQEKVTDAVAENTVISRFYDGCGYYGTRKIKAILDKVGMVILRGVLCANSE